MNRVRCSRLSWDSTPGAALASTTQTLPTCPYTELVSIARNQPSSPLSCSTDHSSVFFPAHPCRYHGCRCLLCRCLLCRCLLCRCHLRSLSSSVDFPCRTYRFGRGPTRRS